MLPRTSPATGAPTSQTTRARSASTPARGRLAAANELALNDAVELFELLGRYRRIDEDVLCQRNGEVALGMAEDAAGLDLVRSLHRLHAGHVFHHQRRGIGILRQAPGG